MSSEGVFQWRKPFQHDPFPACCSFFLLLEGGGGPFTWIWRSFQPCGPNLDRLNLDLFRGGIDLFNTDRFRSRKKKKKKKLEKIYQGKFRVSKMALTCGKKTSLKLQNRVLLFHVFVTRSDKSWSTQILPYIDRQIDLNRRKMIKLRAKYIYRSRIYKGSWPSPQNFFDQMAFQVRPTNEGNFD